MRFWAPLCRLSRALEVYCLRADFAKWARMVNFAFAQQRLCGVPGSGAEEAGQGVVGMGQ